MTPRRGLLALWASVGVFALAAAASMINYAGRMAESISGQGVYSQVDWQWVNAMSMLISPFSIAALITVLIALVVHATLWRRAHVTQQEPQESSR